MFFTQKGKANIPHVENAILNHKEFRDGIL